LVTGASGRLGSNLAARLVREGERVRALILPGDPAEKSLAGVDVERVYGDLRDEKAVGEAMEGCDAVVHAAAVMSDRGLTPHVFFDINCRGSFNVFQAAADRVNRIKRFVYLSSTSAYAVENTGPVIREDSPLNPLTLYGTTKVANEALLRTFRYRTNLPCVVLRPNFIMACDEILEGCRVGWVTGVLRSADTRYTCYNPEAVEPWKIVEQAAPDPKQRVIPYGPGRRPWTWHVVDVRDAVQAVELALAREQVVGETFCIAGPEPMRWDNTVKHLCKRLGEEYVEVDLPNLWHFEFDLTKARAVLGYDPKYTVERMIDDGIAFRSGQDIGVIPPAIAH
jgi:nucleoside-diphosphate-sugar epimerase